MVIITFGLVALFFALDVRGGVGVWLNRFALVSAGAAMALYGVLQAVDGVGLKQAVDAWASAENGDKAVRFAAAETVRWLEWAVRSYQSFVFGLALILFGAVIAVTGRVSRPIGYLMALSGLCYLAQGWIIGGGQEPRCLIASKKWPSARTCPRTLCGSWSRPAHCRMRRRSWDLPGRSGVPGCCGPGGRQG
jgi:hypothetical protein